MRTEMIVMVLAIFVAQYLYSEIFVSAFPDPGELAVFFGLYLAITNLERAKGTLLRYNNVYIAEDEE